MGMTHTQTLYMEILHNRMVCLALGFLLDMLFGDPYRLPHPVRWIGSLIVKLEGVLLRDSDSGRTKRRKGMVFVFAMLFAVGGVTFMGLYIAYHIHRTAGIVLESILCYQMLSMKCLKTESMKVYDALAAGDVERARGAVSMIVGRDTKPLNEEGIIKAAVETVAENTSDGVIAPMLYLALGGGLLGILYKTVNTMDSMVGYKNDKYLDFGRYAAKLDDAVNWVPSRLSALLMVAGCELCKLKRDGKLFSAGNAWRIYRRDRRCHASPNSAQTESVCAGALGIRLAGDAWYFGKKVEKPYIGDSLRQIEKEDIRRANSLLYAASFLMWFLCMAVCASVCVLIRFFR